MFTMGALVYPLCLLQQAHIVRQGQLHQAQSRLDPFLLHAHKHTAGSLPCIQKLDKRWSLAAAM